MREAASILPLAVEGLAYAAGGARLIAEVSFTLPAGGVVAVLGSNGAGKSLLLRLCHGLLAPGAGTIRWAAADGAIGGRRRHAMVFQKPVMLRRSARDNVAHALRAAGASRSEAAMRADAALARYGLADLAQRPARLMSGGEQQRLAIARAAALEPHLMFLDEPCSQLDPGATRQVEAMLADLSARGVTLMMATHDLAQARRLASRVLFLDRGRLLADAPAADFFTSPPGAEARAFLAGELTWS
ncbi:MAG: ATP-binding cassette domain-containing protein [Methylobacteriaceae bacterium]|nr:ATP-binding cassette domain-containing protein [Methylobacteriaceae bacterium]